MIIAITTMAVSAVTAVSTQDISVSPRTRRGGIIKPYNELSDSESQRFPQFSFCLEPILQGVSVFSATFLIEFVGATGEFAVCRLRTDSAPTSMSGRQQV
jgi:hypothetical protein